MNTIEYLNDLKNFMSMQKRFRGIRWLMQFKTEDEVILMVGRDTVSNLNFIVTPDDAVLISDEEYNQIEHNYEIQYLTDTGHRRLIEMTLETLELGRKYK
jgi:hypothetical protein